MRILPLISIIFYGSISWSQPVFQAHYVSPDSISGIFAGPGDEGSILVCGHTSQSPFDAFLMKTTLSGNVIWIRSYGGSQNDAFEIVRPAADGGYIAAGYTQSFGTGGKDALLVKFDTSGNVTWCKTYGTATNDWARDVIQTSDNSFVVTGSARNSSSSGAVYLFKTDSAGTLLWSQMFGTSLGYEGVSILEEVNGEFTIGGNSSNGMSLLFRARSDGTMRWMRRNKPFTLQKTAFMQLGRTISGDYYFTGHGGDPATDWYALLGLADTAGVVKWFRTYTTLSDTTRNFSGGVVQTWDQGFLLCGISLDSIPGGTVIKTDTAGFVTSAYVYAGPAYDTLKNVMRISRVSDLGYVCAADSGVYLNKFDGNGYSGCTGSILALVVDTPAAFDFSLSNLTNSGSTIVQTQSITPSQVTAAKSPLCSGNGVYEGALPEGPVFFPNPTSGVFYINSFSPLKKACIYDITGRCVEEFTFSGISTEAGIFLDQPPGLYLVRVVTESGIWLHRIIRH